MKQLCLKLILPMTALTLFAHADDQIPSINMPLDNKIMMMDKEQQTFYDNRVSFCFGHFYAHTDMGGVVYERLKPDSMYVGIATAVYSKTVGISAVGGYNFLLTPKDRLTPVAGLSYVTGHGHDLFPVLGLHYEREINNVFRVGANFTTLIASDFVYTIGVPLTFAIDSQKRWELQMQPYVVHADSWLFRFTSTGIQGSIAYRF